MTVSKRKKQDKERGGVSTVAAAVAGVVVGAGVAVAGAIALSNENNQKKLKGAFTNVKNKVMGLEGEAEVKLAEGKDKATKTAKTVTEAKKKVKSIWQK
ncbi:TPA: hypothetical protein DDZ02_00030 [candidate division WWE3 bacterium]|nr:hypothetical protein [candidate division WWE3 bacterium]